MYELMMCTTSLRSRSSAASGWKSGSSSSRGSRLRCSRSAASVRVTAGFGSSPRCCSSLSSSPSMPSCSHCKALVSAEFNRATRPIAPSSAASCSPSSAAAVAAAVAAASHPSRATTCPATSSSSFSASSAGSAASAQLTAASMRSAASSAASSFRRRCALPPVDPSPQPSAASADLSSFSAARELLAVTFSSAAVSTERLCSKRSSEEAMEAELAAS
mmetsp:Transcript_15647/g.42159  ORF Transcript_15647/g.42159 Transcript_15647/m.42159 type:complete len:218 (+) Transcript_15647:531-1184(+)